MRPIDKGACPQENGTDKTVTAYQSWRKDLIDRIGYFCVYCNMPLSHSLQVEHVVPKSPLAGAVAGAFLEWDNMLLACGPCNRSKSNKPSNSVLHYLPEEHNSHLPFVMKKHPTHHDAVIIGIRPGLNHTQASKAQATIELLSLDNVDKRDKIVDVRWMKRAKALIAVQSMYDMLSIAKNSPTYIAENVAKNIAAQAAVCGFFGLWYDKFGSEPEVMKALTDNSIIKGTATDCFDAAMDYLPVFRNPVNVNDPM